MVQNAARTMGLFCLIVSGCDGGAGLPVSVEVSDSESTTIDERFLSFAVDTAQVVGATFWSDSGEVEGGTGSMPVPPYDFERSELRTYASALAPAYLRIGGSHADTVYYDLSDAGDDPLPEHYEHRLTRAQWDGVNAFAEDLGLEVLFTLNGGPGPRAGSGIWTSDNARALVTYTTTQQYPVGAWELGNEPNAFTLIHGTGHGVTAEEWVRDALMAKAMLDEVDPSTLVLGPGTAFWPTVGDVGGLYQPFMEQGGHAAVDAVSWHYYPTQSRRCAFAVRRAGPEVMLEVEHLDELAEWSTHMETVRDARLPSAPIWMGETGNAQCGGEPGVSDRFAGTFWWLDQLGQLAARGTQVIVRQTLSGGNYGLIDDATLIPRPDYWASLLFRRLMGTTVLAVSSPEPELRAYAHCTRDGDGDVSWLFLNLSANESIRPTGLSGDSFEHYELSGDLEDTEIRINGRAPPGSDALHEPFIPRREAQPAAISPRSITFLVARGANHPRCR